MLTEDDLEALLEDLQRRKLLSDERYAESRTHALSRKFGAARIVQELRARGLDKGLAERASAAARVGPRSSARERCGYGSSSTPPAAAKSAPGRCASSNPAGFSFDAIRAAVKGHRRRLNSR